jgi:hypothetical protein
MRIIANGADLITMNSSANTFYSPIKTVNGSMVNPGYGFGSLNGTGFYASSSTIGISVNSQPKLVLGDNITANNQILSIDGSVSSPTYSWISSPNSGMYIENNTIKFSIGGVETLTVSSAGFEMPGTGFNTSDGSAAAPAWTFANDMDTGIYRIGNNTLGISTNGFPRIQVDDTTTTILGNLIVQGSTTTVNSTNLDITDNIIMLNKNEISAGISLGVSGLEIERGTAANVGWFYNEANDWWCPSGGNGIIGVGESTTLANISTINSRTTINQNLIIDANAVILNNANGSSTSPSIRWSDSSNTGFYKPSSTNIAIVLSGVNSTTYETSLTTSSVPVALPVGSVSSPSLQFNTSTGLYSPNTDVIGISLNGVETVQFGSTTIFNTAIELPDGDKTNPSLKFNTSTGIFSPSTDVIGFSVNDSSVMEINSSSINVKNVGFVVGEVSDMGAGSVNATNIYQNDSPVATISDAIAFAIVFGG